MNPPPASAMPALSNAPAPGAGSAQLVPDALPHGIKGIAGYQWGLPVWAIVILAIVGGAALLAALWYLWRRWQARRNQRPAENPLLALRRKLAELDVPQMFDRDQQVEYFYELALAFRQLIEATCGFPATDLTVKELRLPLRSYLPLPHSEVEAVVHFFERADLIKFAEVAAYRDEALAYHAQVGGWADTLVRKALQAEVSEPASQQYASGPAKKSTGKGHLQT